MVLSSIFLKKKKRLVAFHLILAVFYLLPLVLKLQILVHKFQRQIRVSCVAQHHLAQHTSLLCCLPYYLVSLESDSCSTSSYLDVRDKVWLVYRALKHRSRGGCTFSKATDHYLKTIQYNTPELIIPNLTRTDDCMFLHLAKKQYLRDEYSGTN